METIQLSVDQVDDVLTKLTRIQLSEFSPLFDLEVIASLKRKLQSARLAAREQAEETVTLRVLENG